MGIRQTTRQKLDKHFFWKEEFKQGNISARRYEAGDSIPTGQLPPLLSDQLNALNLDFDIYVVYSYQTPIGWIPLGSNQIWFIPTQYYSNTTTHHQHVLMWATNYKYPPYTYN